MDKQMAGFKNTDAFRECHALAGALNITGLMVGILFTHQFQVFVWLPHDEIISMYTWNLFK